jgi:hypothetical protein
MSYEDNGRKFLRYSIVGMMISIVVASMLFIPWVYVQHKITDRILRDTYDQNLRMERKEDSMTNNQHIIIRKLDSVHDEINKPGKPYKSRSKYYY